MTRDAPPASAATVIRTDRPSTDHHRHIARFDRRLLRRLQADRQRFDEGPSAKLTLSGILNVKAAG